MRINQRFFPNCSNTFASPDGYELQSRAVWTEARVQCTEKVDRLNLESYIGLYWKSLFLYEFTHCKDNCSVLKEVDWLILNTYTGWRTQLFHFAVFLARAKMKLFYSLDSSLCNSGGIKQRLFEKSLKVFQKLQKDFSRNRQRDFFSTKGSSYEISL